MTAEEILKNSKRNKTYGGYEQLTFTDENNYSISVVKTNLGMSRKEIENILIESVQERYGYDN